MDKKQLHHLWTKLRPIKIWYLLALFLIATTVSVLALRQNNLRMIELREAVYTADEKAGDVEGTLQALRAYVHAHMNTSLSSGQTGVYPPIQLKYTYQRLQQAERERATQDAARIYTDAQNECERQQPSGFSGGSRIPCIENYIAQHRAAEKAIPDALYKFDFVSPAWSPDLAGWSLVVAVMLFVMLIVRVVAGRIAKRIS